MSFSAENLTCVRGGRTVFADRSFGFKPGEMLVLRGANGAGKSSLLRMMAGLLKPASGVIRHDGRDIFEDPESYKRNIAYIGSKNPVKPALTLTENLSVWAALAGEEKPEDAAKAALDALALGDLAETPARFLSAGQAQRVNLARVALGAPKCWLLDEPLNALDDASSDIFLKMLAKHCKTGGSAVIATHDDIALARVKTHILKL